MFSRRIISKRITSLAKKTHFFSAHASAAHGSHHSAHGVVAGPYDLPHHPTYPEQPFFLGVNPKTYKYEGWEFPFVFVFLFSAVVIITGHTLENDAFSWARKEALAREKILENGGEIEFGKYYHEENELKEKLRKKYVIEEVGGVPKVAEDEEDEE